MSETRTNPISVDVLGTLHFDKVKEAVHALYQKVKESHDARQTWMQKQERLIRQRRGIRRDKLFPWPGANNHSWPLTDAIIRRWKPNMASLILQADPVSYFFPTKTEAVEAARIAQAYYHWKFHQVDGLKRTVLEFIDHLAQHGFAYTRQGWNYRTERQCRIVSISAIFPGGPEAAHQQFNTTVAQQRSQVQAAIAAGQAPPDALDKIPEPAPLEDFVRQTLEDEYVIRSDNPLERPQLDEATRAVLAGTKTIKFYFSVVVADKPAFAAISPLDVIVPARERDLSEADFIAIVHRMTGDDIRKRAIDGHFDRAQAATVATKMQSRPLSDPERTFEFSSPADASRAIITSVLDKTDGINQAFIKQSEMDVVMEIYCKLDIDGDKLLEKVVLWYHPGSNTILALYPYPYPFKEWPVVQHKFEHTSTRPYGSRGIAELVSVFQAQVNKLHNARLDAAQITLSPMFQMRTTAGDVRRNLKFMPGTIVPVQAVGDIAPIQTDMRGLMANMTEENYTKNLAEQYIGLFDPSVMSENAPERRTATEVEAITSQIQSVFSQDAMLLQDSMAQVHKQLWHLIQEFGPDEECFRVTGEDKPQLAKKFELAFDFDIVPAGTPANTSKQVAMAHAREALQNFVPDQSGLIDRYHLYKWFFDILDPNMSKLVVRSPEQATLIQQLQQAVALSGQKPAPPP